ncbi:MAG: hypothetical protein PHI31_12570 [Desulfuromonadaceae bacterium]|nr:hypothetical protein [Desulfuromonadaceae bacterium]
MNSSQIDTSAYDAVMKKTKRRRFYFFTTVLMYVPVLYITYQINPSNRVMGTVFALWVVLLVIVTFLAALSKCPRCGNYFHLHGMTLLILRTCLHCQLHINADKKP